MEVCEQMANLDANKYTGHDNIPPKIVKMCRDKIAVSFTSFIKHCINDCHVPIDMKWAEIDPILKKDKLRCMYVCMFIFQTWSKYSTL